MSFDVALTREADSTATAHLLQHFNNGRLQEDLCFALWRPSSGATRQTALIDEIILPLERERSLHGNASFNPGYLSRVVEIALRHGAGIALLHSHLHPGWQDMSKTDVKAERDGIAYTAGATGLPLVGLTVGADGYWSARFWKRDGQRMARYWCEKVRVIGPQCYRIYFNNKLVPPQKRRAVLKRTFDTWGRDSQNTIARLAIAVVGLGSVGCIVAEALARIGVSRITLIDPDRVEEHNLDRLLYSAANDVGKLKVQLARKMLGRHATAEDLRVVAIPLSLQEKAAYKAVLDCDLVFSCVDRPLPRDILNHVAMAHLVPVVDGGIAVETKANEDRLLSAHWKAHLVTPYHQCLRCNGQYNSSMVVMELDGSLDDPSYTSNLPPQERRRNENVFPFSLGAAAMEVNLVLRYLLSEDWWPLVRQQDYQFVAALMRTVNAECHPNCSFSRRRALGNTEDPPYLAGQETLEKDSSLLKYLQALWRQFISFFGRLSLTS